MAKKPRKPSGILSRYAMKGHKQPTNVGTANFPTDPMHDKRVSKTTKRLLQGRR